MIVRALLAGSAVALATGAMAADLPMRKAAPVEYMRVCTQYGPGFFFVPGTDTCLRISGLARSDAVTQSVDFYLPIAAVERRQNRTGFQARGQIDLDARTATPYGALRTFISYRINFGSLTGVFVDRETGDQFFASGFANNGVDAPLSQLSRGYIEFAGLTAGRAYSFFNLPYFETFSSPFTADASNVMFAYTARFSPNLTATVAVEDPTTRRTALGYSLDLGGGAILSALERLEAGSKWPMFVGNIAYDDPMYSLQLSGAVRHIRPIENDLAGFVFGVPGIVPNAEEAIGWAASFGGQIRLPFLAPGDKLYGGVTYSNGLATLSGLMIDEDRFGQPQSTLGEFNGRWDVLTGNFIPTEIFTGHLGLLHYWTPTLRSAISGAVARTENSLFGAGVLTQNFFGIPLSATQASGSWRYRALANLVWSPVNGLDIGAEFMWDRFDHDDSGVPIPLDGRAFSDVDQFTGTVRVQRRF